MYKIQDGRGKIMKVLIASDVRYCEKCKMETCWLKTAVAIKPKLVTQWRCDRCQRMKDRVNNADNN
jgi:hypothetical protein